MFPAAFDYRAPASLAEAVDILRQRGDDAKVMAGGQSLIPLLKLRFSQPALVVDIGRLPDLAGIERQDGHLQHRRADAPRRHRAQRRARRTLCPILPEAVHWIADPLVRNRGTVGGSVCHADPSGRLGLGDAGPRRRVRGPIGSRASG